MVNKKKTVSSNFLHVLHSKIGLKSLLAKRIKEQTPNFEVLLFIKKKLIKHTQNILQENQNI